LREATRELIRVARLRDTSAVGGAGALFDPVRDVRIPERVLYLADTLGNGDGPPPRFDAPNQPLRVEAIRLSPFEARAWCVRQIKAGKLTLADLTPTQKEAA